ncbi:MAG: hypothetical protein ABII18_05545 [bacterium]|nr:hypothetical protein [bacterium]MBU1918604.1 hypothetical protein [bacterium]
MTKTSIRKYHYNWLVAFGIIAVLLGLYGNVLFHARSDYQEIQLLYELRTLRMATQTFQIAYGHKPGSFEELKKATFVDAKGKKRYYLPIKMRAQKELIDPFGKPYLYEAQTGWIKSSSINYTAW